VFQGSYPYHMDDKGRLKMPADFVHDLGGSFTITRGHNGCLWKMPQAEWRGMVDRLQGGSIVDQRSLTLQRHFIGSAVTLSLDGQGRLTVPPVLRDYAAIQHEVMVLGIGSRVEIWARDRHAAYEAQISDALIEELARSAGL
jgi:MraZ protein